MFHHLRGLENGLFDQLLRMEPAFSSDRSRWSDNIRAASRGSYPPVNVTANENAIVVELHAAGLDPERLSITLQQNVLDISGERSPITEEGARYHRRERFRGTFQRSLSLPEDVDPDQVEANYRDGILHIRIARRQTANRRKIDIN